MDQRRVCNITILWLIKTFLELEEKIDERSGKSYYEIAVNLPYVMSKNEFERRFDLLVPTFTQTQLNYFEKMRNKKEYWARAYNKEDSLEQHCTGMVENINRLHKNHVSLKCGLAEYLQNHQICRRI